jgi:hypothetical protein
MECASFSFRDAARLIGRDRTDPTRAHEAEWNLELGLAHFVVLPRLKKPKPTL